MEASRARGVHQVKLENRKDYIILRVQRGQESDQLFDVKRDSPFLGVMVEYCTRTGMGDYRAIRFTFDGKRVHSYQTPDKLDTEDGDIIDAWFEQIGGAI